MKATKRSGWSASTIGIIGVIVMIASACDSGGPGVCELVVDETRSRSEALLTNSPSSPAQFEFQQEVKQYETGDCDSQNADVDRVSLVVRNLTQCVQDVTFQISFIENQDGWSYNGQTSITAGGASDLGVISTVGNANIETAQVILTGSNVQGACP